MKTYHDLLKATLNAAVKPNRTGTDARSIFGYQMSFDLNEGFPLLTTKKLHFKSIAYELLWFLSGDTNIKFLKENGVNIWNEWADENGELGPVYGKQWRRWDATEPTFVAPEIHEIDQISKVIEDIKSNPHSRRHIVSAWNVADLDKMALAPCHCFFQFHVSACGEQLSLQVYQRSADVFLGVPFNIASYALLLHLVALETNLRPNILIWTGGDCHLYVNHEIQARLQLTRDPRQLPRLRINQRESIFDYLYEDFTLEDYNPYPTIKAPIAV